MILITLILNVIYLYVYVLIIYTYIYKDGKISQKEFKIFYDQKNTREQKSLK